MKGYVKIDWVDGRFVINYRGRPWSYHAPEEVLYRWRNNKFEDAERCWKENVSEMAKLMYELLK